ncbi:MAG: hypothetical protein UT50_C0006G0015 [Candidatus Moranbacteria bacterium GW2011_GWA2_39_41]|nr:MAG: hypothetical protein UT50_C0006G0015 [Candidatus Moranbacteria bacterium GW2011_GWA2_39_41]
MNKKFLSWLIVIFVIGAFGGYYFGSKNQKTVINFPDSSNGGDQENSQQNTGKIKLKLNLLQEYVAFTNLPREKFADPIQYANTMKDKVKAINEDELTSKFNATADPAKSDEQRAAEIVGFLSFLATNIKGDLK